MEGMISSEIVESQRDFVDFDKCSLSFVIWAKELVIKLLEITHRQWIHINM